MCATILCSISLVKLKLATQVVVVLGTLCLEKRPRVAGAIPALLVVQRASRLQNVSGVKEATSCMRISAF